MTNLWNQISDIADFDKVSITFTFSYVADFEKVNKTFIFTYVADIDQIKVYIKTFTF